MLIRIFIALTLLSTPAAADRTSRAARHFDSGQELFVQGHLRDAAGEFKRAFELDPLPRYLYNAAQSMRMAGDCAAAVPLYETFLRIAPDEDSRIAASQNMQRCSPPAEPAATAAEPEHPTVPNVVDAPPVAAPPPVAEVPVPAPLPLPVAPTVVAVAPAVQSAKAPTARLRWIGGLSGATAGALLLSAAILEGDGAARFDELGRTCAPTCSAAQVLSLQRQLDAATGLFVAGGLVAAAALVAILVARADARP